MTMMMFMSVLGALTQLAILDWSLLVPTVCRAYQSRQIARSTNLNNSWRTGSILSFCELTGCNLTHKALITVGCTVQTLKNLVAFDKDDIFSFFPIISQYSLCAGQVA